MRQCSGRGREAERLSLARFFAATIGVDGLLTSVVPRMYECGAERASRRK
jgi:hypothetical protein